MENKARPSRPTIGVKDNNNNILRLAPKSENANDKPHYAALNAFEFKRADTDKNTTSIDQPVFTPLASNRPRANLTESSRDAAAAASVGKSRDLAETHSLSIYYMNNKERNEAVNLMLADGEYAMRASHVDPCTDYEEYLRRADRKLGSTVGQRCRSLATQTSFSNSPSPSPSPSSSMRPTSSASSATSTLSKSAICFSPTRSRSTTPSKRRTPRFARASRTPTTCTWTSDIINNNNDDKSSRRRSPPLNPLHLPRLLPRQLRRWPGRRQTSGQHQQQQQTTRCPITSWAT